MKHNPFKKDLIDPETAGCLLFLLVGAATIGMGFYLLGLWFRWIIH